MNCVYIFFYNGVSLSSALYFFNEICTKLKYILAIIRESVIIHDKTGRKQIACVNM